MSDVGSGHDKGRTEGPISVSCEDCSLEGTTACEGCLVTFLLDSTPQDAVIVDVMEARAMRMLHRAGLLPELKFERRVG